MNSKENNQSLSLSGKMYCENEFPNFEDKNFWKLKKKFGIRNKILFVSGGSRNGNHLVTSILDSVDEIPFYPGEDKFLNKLFSLSKENHKNLLKKLNNKNKLNFILKMSGNYYDKWKKIFKNPTIQKKLSKKYWAGNHPEFFVAISEHYNFTHEVNYLKFKKKLSHYFKKKINLNNFFNIFFSYLEAYKFLVPNKKKTIYKYLYACSGMRREMSFLANSKNEFKCIVPIRDYRTFYYSKIKGRYNSNKINNFYLNEAWSQWKNKTIDFLILKKKYPKKFLLVRYEDLINNKSKFFDKFLKELGIKKKYKMKATMHNKPVLGNSSFSNDHIFDRKTGEIKQVTTKKLPLKYVPKDYYKIKKLIKKYCM